MREVATVLFLVVLATAVATFARRWRIPAPSLLVLAGLAVALIPGAPALRIPPQIIALVVLPPLLYAAAEELSLRDLRTVWRPVTILAFGLVLASAAAVGYAAVAVTGLSPAMAFVLGSVLASTDPVAVTALGRRLALPGRVQVLVQAESLFNDATSLVLFKVAVGIAVAAGAVSWPAAGWEFVVLAGGGSLIGAAVAGVVALIHRRTTDPVLETVIALVTPYTAFVLAEFAHTSGVTSVVVAGVLLGRSSHRFSDAQIRLQIQAVYAVVVFLLESVVFSLVGLALPTLVRDLPSGTGRWPLQALVLAAVLIGVRVLWMVPLSIVTKSTGGQSSWRMAAVVTWAGTRGVMPLAAALSIPLTTTSGELLPGRPLALVLTTAVVVFTLVVQGLSLARVVNRSGLALEPEHTAREEVEARDILDRAALAFVDRLADLETQPEPVIDRVRRGLGARLDHTTDSPDGSTLDAAYRELRHEVIAVQNVELRRLYDEHQISETTRKSLQRDLDREDAALGDR
ncbi:Na+/H+ antiporter [Rhodococcus sp. PvR044]|jgi:monovalent cation/hydrogen antiporter|uniref:Na+/H+ antiporter n=1 Tax=Rhodococcus TaxID=1827 RepID=UPI000BCE7E92|nr:MULTISPECIES: Na+/H+ antiporter [Rhodococcus]MCZ4556585.1 Na+/H+ antiporter [Rhodococcus maanshanensis]PTR43570.1 sodium/proton antiporter (CPA1 family) [Rhodococcus sp. OK611]SNX90915.1 sodium/proton antiporter, CPA1 family [Rhodococcus sp. OK270]